MFTGIVEAQGTLTAITRDSENAKLTITAPPLLTDAHLGDSIAVNGVCLTVTSYDASSFTVDVMAETLRRTTLGASAPGESLNLERALSASARLGGHIVTGHIDNTGTITSVTPDGDARRLRITSTPDVLRLIIPQGSIAVDGVSLTVAAVADDHTWFEVALIPHTQHVTTLGSLPAGAHVNLENDVVGKYVAQLADPYLPSH